MRLSTRVRYGIRLLLRLAAEKSDASVSISLIADEESLSLKYLEQIVSPLKSAGIVVAERGKTGGYRLARPVAEIQMLEVFEALGEDIHLTPCVDEKTCNRTGDCKAQPFWKSMNAQISDYLQNTTLEDLHNNGSI